MVKTISRKREAHFEETDPSGAKRSYVLKESVQIEQRSSQVKDSKRECKIGVLVVGEEEPLLSSRLDALKGNVTVGAILPASNANSWPMVKGLVENFLFGNSTTSDTASQMGKCDNGQNDSDMKHLKSESHKQAESNVSAAPNTNVDTHPSSICSAESESEHADNYVTPVLLSINSYAEEHTVAEVRNS